VTMRQPAPHAACLELSRGHRGQHQAPLHPMPCLGVSRVRPRRSRPVMPYPALARHETAMYVARLTPLPGADRAGSCPKQAWDFVHLFTNDVR
jgi:hypothetical protein